MYKCRDCHEEFDEPYVYYETHGFTDGPYEEWSVCPYCSSPDWDDCGTVDRELEEEDQ